MAAKRQLDYTPAVTAVTFSPAGLSVPAENGKYDFLLLCMFTGSKSSNDEPKTGNMSADSIRETRGSQIRDGSSKLERGVSGEGSDGWN